MREILKCAGCEEEFEIGLQFPENFPYEQVSTEIKKFCNENRYCNTCKKKNHLVFCIACGKELHPDYGKNKTRCAACILSESHLIDNEKNWDNIARYKVLDEVECHDFRTAARSNYKIGSKINTTWHPIYRMECEIMNVEIIQNVELGTIDMKTGKQW